MTASSTLTRGLTPIHATVAGMAIDYVELVQQDASGLLAAGRTGPLDAPVEGCPGWDVERLVGHLGRVHRWAAEAARSGRQPEAMDRPPKGPEVLDWYAAGIEPLAVALRQPVPGGWNFVGASDPEGTFWPRRQAVETATHRWDGEAAVGGAAGARPIDAALAADGIDELFSVFTPSRIGSERPEGTFHVHCSDVEGEWTLAAGESGLVVERGHAKGDAALRGPASSVLLALWRRVRPGEQGLEVFGDAAVADRWLALL
jgi:uncharacterized protein (TIGR03083 family)